MEIKQLKISENRIQILKNMGIDTVEDLVSYYPYRYETIEEVLPDNITDKIIIEATVISGCNVYFMGKRSRLTVKVIDKFDHEYKVTIFNRHFLKNQLTLGKVITIIGKAQNDNITASDIKVKPIREIAGILPVYSLKDGLPFSHFRKYIQKGLSLLDLQDEIPNTYVNKYHLGNKKDAITKMHFPTSMEDVKQALKYLKYEEFLNFSVTISYIRNIRTQGTGISKKVDIEKLKYFTSSLPFKLTTDQNKVVNDIIRDLISDKVMYRFLQGDVGSGKTVVASIGLYANYLAGYQGAFMAPTEILARQHYQTLCKFFKDTPMHIALLTGSTSLKEKALIYEKLGNHEIDLIVGTHALFQDKVIYNNLGLVITDEQHRFGVAQRKALKNKGKNVDFIIMSATPIPRTLAIALYGDMDVSTIHTMPNGRKPIISEFVNTSSMKPILKNVEEYLTTGGQVYVICPLVDESDAIDARSATQIAQGMKKYFEPEYHVGLLHGKLDEISKNEVMKQFIDNQIQILVSTTVVEVGVDVKNANMMVIYNSERFGLSQLHQLRGRIGRGDKQAYCYFMSDDQSEEVKNKLKFMSCCHDGFEVSQYDLQMRGPGEMLGNKQSGLPNFVMGDLLKDTKLLEITRIDGETIVQEYYKENKHLEYVETIINKLESNNEYID